jgi:hypothetical protein
VRVSDALSQSAEAAEAAAREKTEEEWAEQDALVLRHREGLQLPLREGCLRCFAALVALAVLACAGALMVPRARTELFCRTPPSLDCARAQANGSEQACGAVEVEQTFTLAELCAFDGGVQALFDACGARCVDALSLGSSPIDVVLRSRSDDDGPGGARGASFRTWEGQYAP